MMRNVFQMPRKSRATRSDSCKHMRRFYVLDRKRSGMEDLLTLKEENGILQPTKWYIDSKNGSSCVQKRQFF